VPVVVTAASGGIGRVLVPELAARGEVRAVVRRPDAADSLRAAGAKVAVCDLADTAALASVMDGAHTVVHLAGGLDFPDERAYREANLDTTIDMLEAVTQAEVRRIVLPSYPGASGAATNLYLRAKGLAEEAVRSSGVDHVILRCTHVFGPGQRWLEETLAAAHRPVAAVVVGPGTQRLAPVFVRDVARVMVAADDRASAVSGTFGLQGPDVVTADRVTDLLTGRPRRKVHLRPDTARRVSRLLGRSLSPALLELLAADSLADAPDAAREFGVELTGLRQGLAAPKG
jgi:uncharacterized protein YbjT (DUF2867 family)